MVVGLIDQVSRSNDALAQRLFRRFCDRNHIRDRILFAVFTHENNSQGASTPLLLTESN
jgi:hypothetical protein